MSKTITIEKEEERAFLIGVHTKNTNKDDYEYSMHELVQLAETAGISIIDTFIQSLDKHDNATLVGKGKLDEIVSKINENNVNTLIFNDNLSPSQARNIAEKSKINIVDRTELILDIFAKHAKTYEAKLQVELAQLVYSYSKLRHLWQHFSRIAGGAVGVRGPGETQIEIDRRLVRDRIKILKDKLLTIKKTTEIKRKKRGNIVSVCLVGYTNAGKSTLFNTLTKDSIYTADKLFATLDSTTRAISFDSKVQLVITDTIGFIEKLPPMLIQSFYSTLYEVREADILLHVVDMNNPRCNQQIETVNKILKELDAADKPVIMVMNKCDLNSVENATLPPSNFINISAKTGINIDILKDQIKKLILPPL